MSDSNLVETQNRWLVVIAAIVMELALGALYMWGGAFVGKIEQISGWDKQSAQIPFSVGVIAFALMVIFAGRYKEKIGTRNLILLSASIMGGGYILGGILPVSPLVTTLTIGAIAGAGSGLAYALPVSVGTKWFPDKKGLVVGLSMAGFGAGSLIWIYGANFLFDPNGLNLSVGTIWIIYGICYAAMIGFSYLFLYDPPQGYTVPGYEPPVAEIGSSAENIDFKDTEMLRTPQFYFIFISFMIGAAAGLMVIGIAKVWPEDVLVEAGFSAVEAAAAATFAAGVMYPLFNGLGRIGYGALNDRIGWKKSMLIMNGLQAVFMFLSLFLISTPITLWIVMAILAANYGGNFSLFPTATDNLWGSKNLAANYGLVFFAYGIGGLLGPNLGGIFRNSGAQEIAIIISGVMLIVSVILIWFTEKPQKN